MEDGPTLHPFLGLKRAFIAAISHIPKPKTTTIKSTVPKGRGRARKAQPSEWLLPVSDDEFQLANAQLKDKPDGTKLSKHKSKYSCSYIKIGGNVYAMANGEYLGEGAYGRVKIVQDVSGRCFAVKIEGKGTYLEQNAEQLIAKAIGYLRGRAERKLDEPKEFKGHEIDTKVYTVVELRKGKEIFQQLYSTVLKPGQLYADDELKRKKDEPLTTAQRLILAYKSCERTNDLHRRGIVHGDLKPANFMSAINGNHIVVGSIDFGFSFRLDKATGQRSVIHPAAPNGTPLKYMPPEVRRAHSSMANKQDAEFSFASDTYSLGVMFRDDIQLSPDIYERMCAENSGERSSITDTMKKIVGELEKIPENERDAEINKIIEESKRGVRQKDNAEPQAKDTLVAQLMSGMRDPRETEGESRSINYTLDDFRDFSHLIFAKQKPEDFFRQLREGYQKLDNTEDKKIYIHNAKCFINELIAMDISQDFKVVINAGINQFLQLREVENDNDVKALFNQVEQELQSAYNKADARKSQLVQDTRDFEQNADGNIDIQDYLQNQLARSRAAGMGSRLNKILGGKIVAIDTHKFKKHANAFAHDLREQQIALLKQIHISDYYNKKSLDRAWETAIYQKIVDLNNKISAMAQQDILSATSKSHQKRLFEFYFNVVEQSIELGDFATATTLFSMLEAGNVGRLQYLKDQGHLARRYEKCQKLMSTDKNNKNLKDEMENRLVAGTVMIPPQGVVAGQSLLNIEDTISTTLNDKTNEFKLSRLAGQLMVAAEAQSNLLSHRSQPNKTTLVSKFQEPLLDEGNLYQLSLKVQGKKDATGNSPPPKFDQAAKNVAEQLRQNDLEKSKERDRVNNLVAEIIRAKATVDALVVATANLDVLMDAKKMCDLIAAAASDKNNSVKLAVKVNTIDKSKIEEINQAIAAKQPAPAPAGEAAAAPIVVHADVPAGVAASVVEPAVIEPAVIEPAVIEPAVIEPAVIEPAVVEAAVVEAAVVEAAVVEAAVVEAAVVEAPVVEAPVVEAPVVEAPVVRADAAGVAAVEEVPALVEAPVLARAAEMGEPQREPVIEPINAREQQAEQEAAKLAKAQAKELAFLIGNEQRQSASRELENLLKYYAMAVLESQSEDPQAVQKALPMMEVIKTQVTQLLNRVQTASLSSNPQIKAAAESATASMSGMVEKYNDLNAHLEAKGANRSMGDVIKAKVKKVARKVKKIARPDGITESKPKDTLGFINALRDETQKRTRSMGAMVPEPEAPSKPQRRVRFADEVELAPAPPIRDVLAEAAHEAEPEVVVAEAAQEPEPLRRNVLPVELVSQSQGTGIPELQRMQMLLEGPRSEARNQIELDAMKMGIGILMALPKDKRPNTFADILRNATIVTDAHDNQGQVVKEAALTILAVLIPPNATLMELNNRAQKMKEKIEVLKRTEPMNEKIRRKIKLREDIVNYISNKFAEEARKANSAAPQSAPAPSIRAESITPNQRASARHSQAANLSGVLKNCIAEFQKMVENIDEPQYKALFKQGVDPRRAMLSILYELREIDPKSVTNEKIDALYNKGKKYWNEENQLPHKDNPLIRLKGQLPVIEQQKGAKPNPV